VPPLDEQRIHEVLHLHRQGMKGRAIARALRISRNTVRQIVCEHADARHNPHCALPTRHSSRRASQLDPFRPQIDELLRLYPDITAQRVFECLREKGFGGGYTVVKDLVRRIRPKPAPRPSLQTAPREPGDMAECDWSPYPLTFTHAPPITLQGVRLHPALLDAQVLQLPRGQRAACADGRPPARLRALRGCGAPVQVR
jgi:transposase